jgi:hypothetical protein
MMNRRWRSGIAKGSIGDLNFLNRILIIADLTEFGSDARGQEFR